MNTVAVAQQAGAEVREDELLALLRTMVETPSPPGHELALAERLADEGRHMAPELEWRVDGFDGSRANLLVALGSADYGEVELMLFAHLDTSLSGSQEHLRLTGDAPPAGDGAGSLVVRDGRLIGPGVAVAKGPAAGALAAMIAAHRSGTLPHGTAVLLTSGGTHRAAPGDDGFAAGLRHALASGLSPRAAINVKAGAPGVLHEEPGSAYLRISVRAPGGPLMLSTSDTCEGAAAALARLVAPIEEWRRSLRSRRVSGSCGRDVGLGALTAGLPDKPDLLPSVAWADVYLITAPGDDAAELAGELAGVVAMEGTKVEVTVVAFMPAGRTDPDHPVIQLAQEAWLRHLGPVPPVEDWRGSTDGAFLRYSGVPVARLGPRPRAAPPGLEALDLDEMMRFVRIDAELMVLLDQSITSTGGP